MNNPILSYLSAMSSRGRGHSSTAGPSSGSRREGVYMSTDLILELIRSTQPPAPAHSSPPRKFAFARMCSDFTHLGGKIFKGTEIVLEVEAWLSSCERIFSRMEISSHHRVL